MIYGRGERVQTVGLYRGLYQFTGDDSGDKLVNHQRGFPELPVSRRRRNGPLGIKGSLQAGTLPDTGEASVSR